MKHQICGDHKLVDSISRAWGGVECSGFRGACALGWTCTSHDVNGDAPNVMPLWTCITYHHQPLQAFKARGMPL